ncbi:MAG: ATP-binding cassette domain-containing protein [Bacteroidetes bacterium]|nr:ATP-binding cassette domain-containing protein [Bacteroidota bacterium]
MTLEFKSVLPFPLREYNHAGDSVWKNEFVLEFPSKVMLNASSGKGKSTFVNTVYGVRHDYDGTILLNGRDLRSLSLHEWIELRKTSMSVIFQDLQLFGELTAWENLQLKNNLTFHRSDAEIMAMLETLGIPDKKNQTCKTLSLGQQQRVAIIRSLLQPFELLLMDEPFSHLDEENAHIALGLICRETAKNNGGFVLTSLGSKHGFTFDRELKL